MIRQAAFAVRWVRHLLAVAAVLLGPVSLFVASPARAAGLLEPSFLESDNYGETFTFVGDLSDGTYVQVQLSVTNIGPGSGHGICRVLWVPPSGAPITDHARVGREQISYGQGTAGAWLQIGPCRATSGSALTVEGTVGGTTVRLRYGASAHPERPPSDVVTVDGRHHRTEFLFVGGSVEGVLEKEGSALIARKGGGYADHSISDTSPTTLARRWVRFRALRPDGKSGLLLAREGFDGGFTPMWRKGATGYKTGGRFEVEQQGTGSSIGFTASFSGEGGAFTIRSTRLLFRHAPFDELGVLKPVLGAFVSAPVTYTLRATLSENGQPPLPGILEISLANE